MPNWCTGNIRFRGNIEDILKLLRENLEYVSLEMKPDGDSMENKTKPAIVKFDDDEYTVVVKSPWYEPERTWCHISNTHRNFLSLQSASGEIYSECFYCSGENDHNDILLFDQFQAAWDIEPDPYMELSQKYGVDIRIVAWERGIGFSRDIVIVNGALVKDESTHYDDYGDWMWNSMLPYVGG